MLAAWRGAEPQLHELVQHAPRGIDPAADDCGVPPAAHAAVAVLHNGLGRARDAFVAARRACEDDEVVSPGLLAELVEAAVRTREADVANAAFEDLEQCTKVAGTSWARGIEARARGLISDGDGAEEHYRSAIDLLSRCRAVPDLARAHLLYGEWFRRKRRRLDARSQLRSAHELFAGMGAAAFACRAEQELLATGERARPRAAGAVDVLTPRETQVARLAGDGRSNPQIGADLFISARTVEYHLGNVFAKLGIESRQQLALALAG